MSVWEDDKALRRFVHSGIHKGVMIVLQEDMASFGKREWTVRGADMPPDWATALERLDKPEGAMT